jgi:hypothetical protein
VASTECEGCDQHSDWLAQSETVPDRLILEGFQANSRVSDATGRFVVNLPVFVCDAGHGLCGPLASIGRRRNQFIGGLEIPKGAAPDALSA